MTIEQQIRIEPMRRRDVKKVMAIEEAVFPEPWSMTIFASELALRTGRAYRLARLNGGTGAGTGTGSGRNRVVGYYGMMYVEHEAHVTTLAVDPSYQGHGLGATLLLDAVRHSLSLGVREFSLEVAASNERAQALYRRFGFLPVGVRKNYYQRTGEDAYVMWVHDADKPEYAARLEAIDAALRSPS
jgi:ribosomal-protein-alanine N-acetyltransferase